MVSRILDLPLSGSKSFFLLGPRGTGKTYWIKRHLADAVYLDLLDSRLYHSLLADPGRLKDYIPTTHRGWVVIDEVQRIPELLNEVHRLIEHEGRVFALTGSSARNLRKKGVNLLAGRALVCAMHPLVPEELGEAFDLSYALRYGMLPALMGEADPQAYLNSYVKTYLREEVMQEGLTRNLSAFSRFLEVASLSQGQVLNMSALAREVGISQKNVSSYFDILEDLLLAVRLPVFVRRAARQTVQHPKFYYFDVGVFRTLRPRGFLDSESEQEGPAIETLVLQTLRGTLDAKGRDEKIYYWRTPSGLEVDFVVYGSQTFLAIELKRSKQISIQDLRGLRAFKKDYPEARALCVYGGDLKWHRDGIEGVPLMDFLMNVQKFLGSSS